MPGFLKLALLSLFLLPPSLFSQNRGVSPLTISEVSENPSGKYDRYRRLMDDLEAQVEISDYRGTAVRIFPDTDSLIRAFEEDRVQILLEGSYTVLRTAAALGVEHFLVSAKDGQPLFRSCFMVPKDSDLQDMDDLAGHVLALEDPDSTSGYFSPMLNLKNRGLRISRGNTRKPGEVRVYLTGEDELILRDLLMGKADCGVVPEYDLEEMSPEVLGRLRILGYTEPMPRSLLLFSPHLSAEDREALKRYFLSLHTRPEGESLLKRLKSERFFTMEEIFPYPLLDSVSEDCNGICW